MSLTTNWAYHQPLGMSVKHNLNMWFLLSWIPAPFAVCPRMTSTMDWRICSMAMVFLRITLWIRSMATTHMPRPEQISEKCISESQQVFAQQANGLNHFPISSFLILDETCPLFPVLSNHREGARYEPTGAANFDNCKILHLCRSLLLFYMQEALHRSFAMEDDEMMTALNEAQATEKRYEIRLIELIVEHMSSFSILPFLCSRL